MLTKLYEFHTYKWVQVNVKCQFRMCKLMSDVNLGSIRLVDVCIFCRYCRRVIKFSPYLSEESRVGCPPTSAPDRFGCWMCPYL